MSATSVNLPGWSSFLVLNALLKLIKMNKSDMGRDKKHLQGGDPCHCHQCFCVTFFCGSKRKGPG
jgi:hypothetical protein